MLLPVETPASVELSVIGGETVPVKVTAESLEESLSEVSRAHESVSSPFREGYRGTK